MWKFSTAHTNSKTRENHTQRTIHLLHSIDVVTHSHIRIHTLTCTRKNFNGIQSTHFGVLFTLNGIVWKRFVSHPNTHIVFTFAQFFFFWFFFLSRFCRFRPFTHKTIIDILFLHPPKFSTKLNWNFNSLIKVYFFGWDYKMPRNVFSEQCSLR